MPHRLHEVAGILKDADLSGSPHLDEHQARSVVNRAYYAAYVTARDFCTSKGFPMSAGGSHEKIVNVLLEQPKWSRVGNQLKQIKALRHQADYQWDRAITWRDANSTLKKSRQIIEAIQGA
ncbi:hypothetical protein LCW13_06035 [Cobetia amphilecti]|uniref:hypothetical protein n=1 Tax=Cobetia amphilecti TaxID=1055104 RepID=UPI001CDAA254|nr:hypothetical protein [Cobetia amphilecti]UBU49813.1 hypothetical protein LCW13_06035 [Cobetia amphilecti]